MEVLCGQERVKLLLDRSERASRNYYLYRPLVASFFTLVYNRLVTLPELMGPAALLAAGQSGPHARRGAREEG